LFLVPDKPSLVKVGNCIRPNDTVCVIGSMQIKAEVEKAQVESKIAEILVQDGESLEYGQVLMRINTV